MINQRSYIPVVPSKTIPDSRPKWAKSTPVFRPKRHKKNPSFWRGTYPYNVRKGVPSPSPLPPPRSGKYKIARASHCFLHFLDVADSSPVVSLEKGEKRFSPFSRGTTGDESVDVATRHHTGASNRSLTT